MSDSIAHLIRKADPSEILSVRELKEDRDDLVVACASGRSHLVRLEQSFVSLQRQKWGYEQLRISGIPCPQVEVFIEPDDVFPAGCMVVSWVDAIAAENVIRRKGECEQSHSLCRELGRLLRRLHNTRPTGDIPEYIFTHTQDGSRNAAHSHLQQLREAELVDAKFGADYWNLLELLLAQIPDPRPETLCFTDMHFGNVLVQPTEPHTVAAVVDIEEIGVGWPYWDFTNWECWGLRFDLGWTRPHILEGYGPIDMELCRMALLVRLARPFTFAGSTREQILKAVDSGNIMDFELRKLYQ